jgi:hypothetical protein
VLVGFGHRFFQREGIRPIVSLLGLIGLVLIPAIPVMTMIGMEHVLQCVLALWFAHLCVTLLSDSVARSTWTLPVVAGLLVSVRYEGLFLVLVATLLMLLVRKSRASLLILVGGVTPVVVFGLFSASMGWQFLPNSLLVKSQLPDLPLGYLVQFKIGQTVAQLLELRMLSMIAVLVVFTSAAVRDSRFINPGTMAVALTLGAFVLHVGFARTGHYYFRYEAYLAVLTVYAVVLVLGKVASDSPTATQLSSENRVMTCGIALGFVLLVLGLPVFGPTRDMYAVVPQGCANIYTQQCQMGRFVSEYFADDHVALNDIGAVSFLSSARVYDLWGLGTMDVWMAKEARTYDTEWISRATRQADVDIAIVYEDWFASYGGLPDEWIHVGTWTIPANVICGGDSVAFYAVDPTFAPRLATSLAQFSGSLPAGVREAGEYVDGEETLI